jgi:hypothetical protein
VPVAQPPLPVRGLQDESRGFEELDKAGAVAGILARGRSDGEVVLGAVDDGGSTAAGRAGLGAAPGRPARGGGGLGLDQEIVVGPAPAEPFSTKTGRSGAAAASSAAAGGQLDEGRGPWGGAPAWRSARTGMSPGSGGCRIELNPQRDGVAGGGRGQVGRKVQ